MAQPGRPVIGSGGSYGGKIGHAGSPVAEAVQTPSRTLALSLRRDQAAATSRHNQCLSERMRVPGRARAGFERDAGAADARRIGRLEQRVDADRAGEPFGRPLAGWLCAVSLDVHRFSPSLAGCLPMM